VYAKLSHRPGRHASVLTVVFKTAARCLAVIGLHRRPMDDGVRKRLERRVSVRYQSVMATLAKPDVWRDWERCDRARVSRDPAYDGLFFTCVRTTKIYCRPVCPVAPALSKNVFFVPSAPAAERLGFRPCLRCRPETSPGSPAWRGTETTVSRGMRLIEDGFLDGKTVGDLADALGVGMRHLTRLFAKHVGATPMQVAATRRVQIAKRLISDTALPLGDIAFAAGFQSIRRFNDAFHKIYKRAPSTFRLAPASQRSAASVSAASSA
jgi:AraC family transcriptional regulator of adaptative response/methylated-DNA-[protein]-cysteine methyltransferase